MQVFFPGVESGIYEWQKAQNVRIALDVSVGEGEEGEHSKGVFFVGYLSVSFIPYAQLANYGGDCIYCCLTCLKQIYLEYFQQNVCFPSPPIFSLFVQVAGGRGIRQNSSFSAQLSNYK